MDEGILLGKGRGGTNDPDACLGDYGGACGGGG